MACYSPHNQYYLPRPWLFANCPDKTVVNFVYGAAYGGAISLLFCNPLPRTIKMTVGWGLAFTTAFTRGLYNTPGYLKRTDNFKPLLDRDALSIYIALCSALCLRFCDILDCIWSMLWTVTGSISIRSRRITRGQNFWIWIQLKNIIIDHLCRGDEGNGG